jgi:hypothetical protein
LERHAGSRARADWEAAAALEKKTDEEVGKRGRVVTDLVAAVIRASRACSSRWSVLLPASGAAKPIAAHAAVPARGRQLAGAGRKHRVVRPA